METNICHRVTPTKRFLLDRSECGLPIRTSTPISKTIPDVDIARKDSNGQETSFKRLRATVLFDTSDGGQFMVSYDAPAPQTESPAHGRPVELTVTQMAALATPGSLAESHQQHRSSFVVQGSLQPAKSSSTDSFLQPSQEPCGELVQHQEPCFSPRGSRNNVIQQTNRIAFSSTSSRVTVADLEKPELEGKSLETSDGVLQHVGPSSAPQSDPTRRGKLPQCITGDGFGNESDHSKQVRAKNRTSGTSKDHAKDQKPQAHVPGKSNLRSKGKTDAETVTRGNTFAIKSPKSDGLAKKPLGGKSSIAISAKPKLVPESGSAAKSHLTRTNIPQLPVLKGQRPKTRMSDIGMRKTETTESTRTRSKSISRNAETTSSAIPQSTPRCNFRKQKDVRGSAFSASTETGSMKYESGKSTPACLKGKLARVELSKVSKVVQASKRMPPIMKVVSPSLKRTLTTSEEINADEIRNSSPTNATDDRTGVKDLFPKSCWKSILEEATNSIPYRAPNMESARIKDAKLQPRHSPNHQQLQQEQKQFEDPELRSSMSDVEEEEEEEEVASLAIPSLPVSCDSNQRKREAAARPLSVARGLGLAQKQWNKNWSDESFEIRVALNLSQHVDNLLTQLQKKVSDPGVFQLCMGRNARSSLPRYRSANMNINGLLKNLRSAEKKVKALLEVAEECSSFNRDVA